MIEKWHPAFDGCGHAHVVLLHEQFHQISLDVGVEQPLQHFARRVVPVIEDILICRARRGFPREFAGQQSALLRFAEGGEEITEVERSPGVAVLREKSVFQFPAQGRSQQRRGRNRVAQSAPQNARDDATVRTIHGRILQSEGIASVARQGLIRALASEHDRNSLSGEASDKIERDARRPHDGLVFMPDQMRQRRKKIVLAEQHFMMARMDVIRPRARKGQFAVHVIFVNSTAGLRARPNLAGYSASQHSLRVLADALRDEVNMQGIRVTSIYLGRTATKRIAKLFNAERKVFNPALLLQPDDVAESVLYALSLPATAE